MSDSPAEVALHNGIIASFKAADANGNGSLQIAEMTKLLTTLNPALTAADCKKLFDAADTDNNGQVNYTEFVNWLHRAGNDAGVMNEDVHTFLMRFDDAAIFEKATGNASIGRLKKGDKVVSGGPVVVVDGYAMLPIMAPMIGFVEANRVVHEYVVHGEVQWKLHAAELRGFQVHNQCAKPRGDDPDFPDFVNEYGTKLVAPATLGPVMAGVAHVPHMVKLFEEIRPDAIRQGHLGDCWLLAAISNLCEFPDLVRACFPDQSEISVEGNYRVRLFDPTDGGKAHIVAVTDTIPFYEGDRIPCQPVYSKPMGNEIFVQILEKACAKLLHTGKCAGEANGWKAIESGSTGFGFAMLTGAPDCWIFSKTRRGWVRKKLLSYANKNQYSHSGEEAISNNQAWALLKQLDADGSLISAAMNPGKTREHVQANGLVAGHAFTVLSAVESNGMSLVKCRNPWGGNNKWNGACSDASGFWDSDKGKRVAQDVGYTPGKANGAFWMPLADFFKNWDTLHVCECHATMRQDD